MFTYDRELMQSLRRQAADRIEFVDFEGYLDDWLARMPERSREQVVRDYRQFRDFYFRHNHDPDREARITSYLDRAR